MSGEVVLEEENKFYQVESTDVILDMIFKAATDECCVTLDDMETSMLRTKLPSTVTQQDIKKGVDASLQFLSNSFNKHFDKFDLLLTNYVLRFPPGLQPHMLVRRRRGDCDTN